MFKINTVNFSYTISAILYHRFTQASDVLAVILVVIEGFGVLIGLHIPYSVVWFIPALNLNLT